MKPPALRRTDRPMARRLVVEHVKRNDRPFGRRGDERRLVGQAQILPQPDNGRLARFDCRQESISASRGRYGCRD